MTEILTKNVPKNEAQLYNVKILRNFVSYLRGNLGWSNSNIGELFLTLGKDISYIDSEDNWFGQSFADDFYYQLVRETGDPDIAYKVGQYSISQASKGIVGRIIESFGSTTLAFKSLEGFAKHYTRAGNIELVTCLREKVVIRSKPTSQCIEKPYQCQNRMGMWGAIPRLFNCSNIRAFHQVCYHTGGDYCEYTFTWKEPLSSHTPTFAILTFLSSFFLGTLLHTLGGIERFALSCFITTIVVSLLRELRAHKLLSRLNEQNIGLELSVNTLDRRNQESVLLRNIIKLTTKIMPIVDLCEVTAKELCTTMKYDRALVMLYHDKEKLLKSASSYGYPVSLKQKLEKAEFSVRAENLLGHFSRVVTTRKPLLVKDVPQTLSQLSDRSKELALTLGTQSFVACPILIHNRVLGIVVIENIRRDHPVNHGDLVLLEGLCNHLAVAFSNAINFDKESHLRQLFQKYVPTEVRLTSEDVVSLPPTQTRELSIMFIDIVRFTPLGEELSPNEVVKLLNVFIEEVQNVAAKHGGLINKIMGDGMLLYFDPKRDNSVLAGIDVLKARLSINRRLKDLGLPPISLGIGIHRGTCILGNIGSESRLDYTVIGDAVNTAARVESITRKFGENKLCISDSVVGEAKDLALVPRGEVLLKGKAIPVKIFEVTTGVEVEIKNFEKKAA